MAYVKATVREEQIVSAAIRVLSRVGVPGATLRAVAAEASIPLGTMQYVFPTKDQLLRTVLTTVTHDISEALRVEVELDKGLEHALRQGLTSFWTRLVMHDIGLQVMQYELTTYSIRTEGPGGLAHQQYERYTSLLTEFCRRAAQAAGERCEVSWEVLGRLTLAGIDGLILQFVAHPDRDRTMADLDHVLDMIVLYARPRRSSSDQED